MPIAPGGNALSKIMYGTTPITRVYAGATLVYDAAGGGSTVDAALRSVSSASVPYSTTAKTIAKPSGTASGDLLLLIMHCDYGAATDFKVPSGFSTLTTRELSANGDKHVIGYKIAGSSEPASYTMTVPVDADLRADLLCIQGADANQAPSLASTATASSATSHAAPSVTPLTSRGLLVTAASLSSGSAGQTFSWTPPTGMTERTDAATNGYVTMTTATQQWNSSSATGSKAFGLSMSATAKQALTASIVVPSGSGTAPAPEPEPEPEPVGYAAAPSNGSGGSWADAISTSRTFVDSAGTSSVYRFWGSHVTNRTGPIPLVVHLHGDGAYEYKNPTTWTSPQYMQVAKDLGGIGVIPKAMDMAGGYESWWAGTRGAAWAKNLILEMCRLYNIDKRQIYLSGFSGGAVIIAEDIMVKWHADFLGGGAMLLGGGQPGTMVGTPSAALLRDFPMRWHVGTNDTAANAPDGYDGRAAAEEGEAYYRARGFNTALTYIQGENHNQSEDDGPAAFRALVNISRNIYALPTI